MSSDIYLAPIGTRSDVSTALHLMLDMFKQYWWVYLVFVVVMLIIASWSLKMALRSDRHGQINLFGPILLSGVSILAFCSLTTNEFSNWWYDRALSCTGALADCPRLEYMPASWYIGALSVQVILLALIIGSFIIRRRPKLERAYEKKAKARRRAVAEAQRAAAATS